MLVYHLTTSDNARKIQASGIMYHGSFCGGQPYGVFCSISSSFSWLEVDVIIGYHNLELAIVVFDVDAATLLVDPEAYCYNENWRYIPTNKPIGVDVIEVLPYEGSEF